MYGSSKIKIGIIGVGSAVWSGYKLMNRVVNYYVDLDDYYVPLEAIWLQERISSEGYVVREINIECR